MIGDVDARAALRRTACSATLLRLVGRVVEDLDFEQLPRIVDLADGVDQPIGHVHLVVDRELDRDAGSALQRARRDRHARPLFFMYR